MSNMPERIWAWFFTENLRDDVISGGWTEEPERRVQEYIRADIVAQLVISLEEALAWTDETFDADDWRDNAEAAISKIEGRFSVQCRKDQTP